MFGDERGFFYESFNQKVWQEVTRLQTIFVQDNHSRSGRNVLRGLHYQIQQPQGKLVRVVAGEVFDVAVDIRIGSPTFSRWVGAELSAENKRMLWIPEGFAHGFLVLSEFAEFLYKTTDYWAPRYERTIIWNDPDINIDWGITNPILSEKDQKLKTLNDVGLGYIHLGQQATTLSGGEAQRVKLATELSRMGTGKTLYVLDEPTTGLHFADVHMLLEVLNKLVDKGNTVLIIEHNMDVIKNSDWVGPEGGDQGGTLLVAGTPEFVAQDKKSYTGKYLKKVL